MSYNAREALQLALASTSVVRGEPGSISLTETDTRAILRRAKSFEKYLDKSDKRAPKENRAGLDEKSEGAVTETTPVADEAEGTDPRTPETVRDAENAKYHSDGYAAGWNDALDAVQKAADAAGYGKQAQTILFGMTK